MHVLCKDSWKSRHSLGATAATRPRTNNWKDSETLIYKLKLFLSSTSQFSAFLSKAVSVRFTHTRPLKCKMKNLDKKTCGIKRFSMKKSIMVNIFALFDISVSIFRSFDPPCPSRCTMNSQTRTSLQSQNRIYWKAVISKKPMLQQEPGSSTLYPNYNDKEGGTEDTFKIVKHGVKVVDITSVNGSMFLIDGGIVLFEHFLYGGDRKVLRI